MFLEITGFLVDDSEDDSLKFALNIDSECEAGVMKILGWESLADEANGELPLTTAQVEAVSVLLEEPLPMYLDLFIGVRP